MQVRNADAIGRLEDLDGLAKWRQCSAVIDVVHPLERDGLPRVHLEDDAVGHVNPRLVIADRGRRNQFTVRSDTGHLNDRDVEVSEGALPDHLRDVREVHIEVVE